jgi:hypothetical protein
MSTTTLEQPDKKTSPRDALLHSIEEGARTKKTVSEIRAKEPRWLPALFQKVFGVKDDADGGRD